MEKINMARVKKHATAKAEKNNYEPTPERIALVMKIRAKLDYILDSLNFFQTSEDFCKIYSLFWEYIYEKSKTLVEKYGYDQKRSLEKIPNFELELMLDEILDFLKNNPREDSEFKTTLVINGWGNPQYSRNYSYGYWNMTILPLIKSGYITPADCTETSCPINKEDWYLQNRNGLE